MKWFAVTLALLFSMPALAQPVNPGPSTAMTPTPDDRAKQWIILIDDGNYAEAWKQAGATLRNKNTAEKFAQQMNVTRTPLGAMSSRTIKDVKLTKTRPGMRDGQYATVRFDSAFAHKVGAVETVALMSENGGWSVIDYQIN
jgi:hypothetical protein